MTAVSFCPFCGIRRSPAAKFCTNCGTRVRQIPAIPSAGGVSEANIETTPPTLVVPAVKSFRSKHQWYRPSAVELLAIVVVAFAAYSVSLSVADSHMASVYLQVARVTGFISYALLTMAIFLGTLVATRWRAFTRPWLIAERLHPLCLLLAGVFLGFHLAGLLLDHFSPWVLFVPFVPSNRVLKAAMGILAMYLMIGLTGSTYVISRIGFRVWRLIHYSGFLSWIAATGHGVAAGSDSGAIWARAFYSACGLVVLSITATYLVTRRSAATKPAIAGA